MVSRMAASDGVRQGHGMELKLSGRDQTVMSGHCAWLPGDEVELSFFIAFLQTGGF